MGVFCVGRKGRLCWLLREDREFLGLRLEAPARYRAGLGLEFDFAVGEELADAGAFGWGEVIVPQIQLGQVVQLPDFGRQARQFIAP